MEENADVLDETAQEQTTAPEGAEATPVPKKKSKKKPAIIAGVIVAVLVVAGVGMWVWHESPSFCSAICHTPMDPYLDTYEATPGESATDKWGNEVEDASGMLACVHRVEGAEEGTTITCLSCHVPTLSEQVNEALEWITGNYVVTDNATYGVVLYETDAEALTEARGVDEDSLCLNESCHNMTREELGQLTAGLTRNPHDLTGTPHSNTYSCTDCHKAHRASVNQCTNCHSDATTPDGWLTTTEEKKLAATATE